MNSAKIGLIDSSSAIILFKSEIFDPISYFYRIIMTLSVYKELTEEDHAGSDEFRRLLDAGRISIVNFNDVCMDECDDLILQGLDVGERDTIRLFRAGIGEIIILDDWKGASYCKNNAIPYINALLVPRILLLAGIISKSESEESMSRIVENGWYSQWVIDYARFCPDEKLLPFL